jgi:hypothetical protein
MSIATEEITAEELRTESRLARVGEFASIACAIHCAAMPILIGAGAAGTLSFLRHEPVEWGMVLLAAVVGTVAAWKGLKTHGNLAVVTVLMLAILALVGHAAHLFDEAGHEGHVHGVAWTGIIAGVALAASLFVNNRMCKTCHECAHGRPTGTPDWDARLGRPTGTPDWRYRSSESVAVPPFSAR